jgi:transposase-like protein
MQRPDLNTLACVNPECQCFRHPGEAHLTVRKVYGPDRIRLLRCRTCGEAFSERRGSALFNTKLPAATAENVISHLDEGCSVRATARLVKVAKETVARLLRVTGRHAQRFHDQQVHGLTPKALEFDEQWSFVKKSSSDVKTTRWLVIGGTTRQ